MKAVKSNVSQGSASERAQEDCSRPPTPKGRMRFVFYGVLLFSGAQEIACCIWCSLLIWFRAVRRCFSSPLWPSLVKLKCLEQRGPGLESVIETKAWIDCSPLLSTGLSWSSERPQRLLSVHRTDDWWLGSCEVIYRLADSLPLHLASLRCMCVNALPAGNE